MQHQATSALPPDLRGLVEAWLEIERETELLVAPLDDEQFNWSPTAGAWSIAQCFDHLNRVDHLYLTHLKKALASARATGSARRDPIAPTWFGRRFISSQEPPVRTRVRTFRRLRPAVRKLKAEVWPEFVRLHGQLRMLAGNECVSVDLNRMRFANPIVPVFRIRAGTALHVIAAHDRRHVWQAQNVRALPGFPRS